MLTVGADGVGVEKLLREGGLSCPGCAAPMGPWGFARPRWLRCVGGLVRLRPRRSRCSGCGATHVLLPLVALLRRADTAVVIGTALALKAAGLGHRRIAVRLGRPAATVRGWLRRFAERAETLRRLFTTLAVRVDADPGLVAPTGSPFADAVAAVGQSAAAMVRRWPVLLSVSAWEVACAVTHGQLLDRAEPPQWINTNRLWPST
jgi:Homeodomain-like domain